MNLPADERSEARALGSAIMRVAHLLQVGHNFQLDSGFGAIHALTGAKHAPGTSPAGVTDWMSTRTSDRSGLE